MDLGEWGWAKQGLVLYLSPEVSSYSSSFYYMSGSLVALMFFVALDLLSKKKTLVFLIEILTKKDKCSAKYFITIQANILHPCNKHMYYYKHVLIIVEHRLNDTGVICIFYFND